MKIGTCVHLSSMEGIAEKFATLRLRFLPVNFLETGGMDGRECGCFKGTDYRIWNHCVCFLVRLGGTLCLELL